MEIDDGDLIVKKFELWKCVLEEEEKKYKKNKIV